MNKHVYILFVSRHKQQNKFLMIEQILFLKKFLISKKCFATVKTVINKKLALNDKQYCYFFHQRKVLGFFVGYRK